MFRMLPAPLGARVGTLACRCMRLASSARGAKPDPRPNVSPAKWSQTARASRKPSSIFSSARKASPIRRRREPDLLGKRHTPQQFQLLDPEPTTASANRVASFEALGFSPKVVEAIEQSIKATSPASAAKMRPTEIQVLAARQVEQLYSLDSRHNGIEGTKAYLLAAETGSGKTLAYLAPIFDMLKRHEAEHAVLMEQYNAALAEAHQRKSEALRAAQQAESAAQSDLSGSSGGDKSAPDQVKLPKRPIPLCRPGYPRAIVLVPTHDLLHQVGAVAKAMSHTARLRVLPMSTSTSATHTKRKLADPVDVLITTPGTLAQMLAKETIHLAETRVVVCDEADFIFDQGFAHETTPVLEKVRRIMESRRQAAAFLFVSATVPKSLHAVLTQLFPDLETLASSALHRPLTRCAQVFIDVPKQFQSNKHTALLDTLRTHHRQDGATLVFCNMRHTVEAVCAFLESRNITALKLSGAQTLEERTLVWHTFQKQGGILVATDVASRGLDTTHVDTVVCYDFPTTVIEYLHRIGRTARAGRKGTAISLFTRRSRELVTAIQQRIKQRSGLSVA